MGTRNLTDETDYFGTGIKDDKFLQSRIVSVKFRLIRQIPCSYFLNNQNHSPIIFANSLCEIVSATS